MLLQCIDWCWHEINVSEMKYKKRPEGHFKVWATNIFFQRPLPPTCTPRAETGLPLLQSIQMCRLGYHQSEAWLVEQKALPPQLYVASVTTGIRTHALLNEHQSLNTVLLTTRPWHATKLHLPKYYVLYIISGWCLVFFFSQSRYIFLRHIFWWAAQFKLGKDLYVNNY